jgi:hypothetical protein
VVEDFNLKLETGIIRTEWEWEWEAGGGLRLAFCRFSGIIETPALLYDSK